jgi:iron complex outermembrane recepter protein
MKKISLSFYALAFLFSTLAYAEDLSSNSLEELMGMESEAKAVVGSRSGSRDFLNSIVPIDVITNSQIQNSGQKKLTQILSYFIPGFNSPTPAIKDGSDHVPASSLRGLNPDQVLVLINGKRLHTSALLHVNDTVGRGTSGANLNTIAVASIDHIEILRDGAAAQYGSDAIAGVINVILKNGNYTNSVSSKIGMNLDGGGESAQADLFYTVPLDYDGYLNVTADVQTQNKTDRAGIDTRDQYSVGDTGGSKTTPLGQPEATNYLLALNSKAYFDNDVALYTSGILNYQDSSNNAYFRTPKDVNSSLYPNGFLPNIKTKMLDYSLTAGFTQDLGSGSSWDLSQTMGSNDFHYYVSNSMNYSMGTASPTSFDAGGLSALQAVTNLDYKTKVSDIKVAMGLEYKYETYKIEAGDRASYAQDSNASAGSQGFPGFRPENEVATSRNNYSIYLDLNYNITPAFLVDGAVRFEDYSDFGSTTNYKLALSYKLHPSLLVRASGSTGFKAPSLGQSHFTSNSTTVVNGVLSATGTLSPIDTLAQALGAKALKAETSEHFTTGFVYKPVDNLSVSTDYFYTKIKDRIMLSTDIAKSAQTVATQALYTARGITQARYLTNAVNTQTQGLDLRVNYLYLLENSANLSFNGAFSYAKTKVLSFNSGANGLAASVLEKNRIENAQPKDNLKLLFNYDLKPINIALNVNRYGAFKDVYNSQVYNFDAQWSSDLDVSYAFTKKFKVALGGTNIFNSSPDEWPNVGSATTGSIVPYSQYSPLGYSGAYYYLRAIYEF